MLTWPLTPCPSPFYLKSHATAEKTTTRLMERPALPVPSAPSAPSAPAPDCTYANFERFVHLVEELTAVGSGISEVEAHHLKLQQDVQRLLRVCSDREAWCSEEGEQLSEACCEFVNVEEGMRLLQDDLRAVDASLDRIRGSFRQRWKRLDALRMDSELLLSSLLTGEDTQSTSPTEESERNKS